jgi:hypothetical protein
MAIITTYNTLIQAIKDNAEDDSTEFSDYLPVAIDAAEERLFRELDMPELEEGQTGSLVDGTYLYTKPTGYKFAEHFIVTNGSTKVQLQKKQDSYIQDYWPDNSETDVPKYYGDKNLTQFIVAPTPDDNYSYEIKFTQKPQKLSSTNTSNYYIEKCSDILFFACMVEMSKFMKAWDQIPLWNNEFTRERDAWNIQAMRYRRDGGITPMYSEGGNTIKHTVNTGA